MTILVVMFSPIQAAFLVKGFLQLSPSWAVPRLAGSHPSFISRPFEFKLSLLAFIIIISTLYLSC